MNVDNPTRTAQDVLKKYNELDNLALKGIVPDRSGVEYLTLEEAQKALYEDLKTMYEDSLTYLDPHRFEKVLAQYFGVSDE